MRWSGLIFPFLQRAKFNTCSFSLRSCWNNLWMKRYVLSIVKTVITLHQPRLFHGNRTEAHFLFMQRLCSDSCCQDLAQMTHQFPIHILPHQSNLHSLSPVISCRFEGCNLKHECCRFSNVCFSYSSWWLKKKNPSVWIHYAGYQVCWKYFSGAFISCLQVVDFLFFLLSPRQRMRLLFLKEPNLRLVRALHARASCMHCARAGKHLLSEVRVHRN